MGASALWTLVFVVALVVSSPVPRPRPAYDARLSTLELAIIKCIVETVPGVTKGGGGSFDWSVVQSKSKELEGAEVEVIQVRERDPDFSGRSGQEGGDGYPDDWNIVRSVSSQLEAKENAGVDSQYSGSEGASDDWTIVRSISTELHLDAEQAPAVLGSDSALELPQRQTGRDDFQPTGQIDLGSNPAFELPQRQAGRDDFQPTGQMDLGSDPAFELPQRQAGRDDFQPTGQIVFPGTHGFAAGEDDSEEDSPIGIRLQMSHVPSGMIMDVTGDQQTFYQPESVASRGDQSSGIPGEKNNGGGAIVLSIDRSMSSEQEPIDEKTSSGSQQTVSTSGAQAAIGETDSYDLVQPISTELQPADSEAGDIPASLTQIVPPSEHQTVSWMNQPAGAAQPSEIYLPDSQESPSLDTQKPCETGHRRVKDICQKVHTFQLKSHVG